MFVNKKQLIKILFMLIFVSSCAFLTISCPLNASPNPSPITFNRIVATDANLDLGDRDKFDFELKIITQDEKRLLVTYRKNRKSDGKDLGKFFKISDDGGETFGKEHSYPQIMEGDTDDYVYRFSFFDGGIAVMFSNNVWNKDGYRDNMFYSRSDENFENWSEPSRINDVIGNIKNPCNLTHEGTQNIYCAWSDHRSGTGRGYFSASYDGGETWSINREIDPDFRNAAQSAPRLVFGENGRLHVFWTDKRDEKTLLDVRNSYSDDKGKNWSKSKKVNDDTEPVWQTDLAVVSNNGVITVAFSDFREDGVEGDRDWNIFYTRSTDNGETWEKNKRLNDVKFGRQLHPKLAKDSDGNLFCIWQDKRKSLFGQYAFSYSKDGGISWSPSVLLTEKEKMLWRHIYLFPTLNNKILMVWKQRDYEKIEQKQSFIEFSSELSEQNKEGDSENVENFEPLKFELGEKLFEDDFSSNSVTKWTEVYGVWDLVDGTYKGSSPGERKSFIATAKFSEPEQYVAKGRFKLDPQSHISADLYLRMDDSNLRYYLIRNRFRHGAWLSLKDNDLDRNLHYSGGKVLEQKPFPFRNDRWYEWKLVVTPNQIDYYLDGKLMISHKEELQLKNNKFGIGGLEFAPTYFDDIEIYELKE